MRALADAERIRSFLKALGERAREEARVYLAGGATAVLYGWRASTVDVDLKVVPDTGSVLRAIPDLKEALAINVELASPDDFIPELPGWEERSPFIAREGSLSFHHYDPNAQALAKIERGHEQDLRDAEEMVRRGLIQPADLLRFYELTSRPFTDIRRSILPPSAAPWRSSCGVRKVCRDASACRS